MVLDNLSSHKSKPVRRIIRGADAHLLFLLSYSPDLNSIEQAFVKLKHMLRDVETCWYVDNPMYQRVIMLTCQLCLTG